MSDEQGRYQLLNLNVGRYEIEVSLSGFQTAVRSGIVLAVGDQTVVNFTLQVGQVAEKVEVTAQAPLVDTTTSSVGGIIETSQIVNLPLNGRSFDELAQLQPGVTAAKFAGVGTMQSGYTTKIWGMDKHPYAAVSGCSTMLFRPCGGKDLPSAAIRPLETHKLMGPALPELRRSHRLPSRTAIS